MRRVKKIPWAMRMVLVVGICYLFSMAGLLNFLDFLSTLFIGFKDIILRNFF